MHFSNDKQSVEVVQYMLGEVAFYRKLSDIHTLITPEKASTAFRSRQEPYSLSRGASSKALKLIDLD